MVLFNIKKKKKKKNLLKSGVIKNPMFLSLDSKRFYFVIS